MSSLGFVLGLNLFLIVFSTVVFAGFSTFPTRFTTVFVLHNSDWFPHFVHKPFLCPLPPLVNLSHTHTQFLLLQVFCFCVYLHCYVFVSKALVFLFIPTTSVLSTIFVLVLTTCILHQILYLISLFFVFFFRISLTYFFK